MAPPKRTSSPAEESPPALLLPLRSEVVLSEGGAMARVVYKTADDYAENAARDMASIEALPGWSIVSASLGPTSSTGRGAWPLLGEWVLSPNRTPSQ